MSSKRVKKLIYFYHWVLIPFFLNNPSWGEKGGVAEINWPKTPYAKYYKIQIAKDSQFNQIIVNEATFQPNYRWLGPGCGIYYFRIASVDSNNVSSVFSRVSKLVIVPEAPELVSKFGKKVKFKEKEKLQLRVEWKSAFCAHRYNLRVIKGNNEGVLYFDTTTKDTVQNVVFKEEGFYRVRISGISDKGWRSKETVSPGFRVEKEFDLNPPNPIAPHDGIVVDGKLMPRGVAFRWSKVSHASFYRFILYKVDKSRKKILFLRRELMGVSFLANLYEGEYYWKVASLKDRRARDSELKYTLQRKLIVRKSTPLKSLKPVVVQKSAPFKLPNTGNRMWLYYGPIYGSHTSTTDNVKTKMEQFIGDLYGLSLKTNLKNILGMSIDQEVRKYKYYEKLASKTIIDGILNLPLSQEQSILRNILSLSLGGFYDEKIIFPRNDDNWIDTQKQKTSGGCLGLSFISVIADYFEIGLMGHYIYGVRTDEKKVLLTGYEGGVGFNIVAIKYSMIGVSYHLEQKKGVYKINEIEGELEENTATVALTLGMVFK